MSLPKRAPQTEPVAATDQHALDANRLSSACSFLFVPGDRPDRFEKACRAGAEAVILDLEDGVAPHRRPYARDRVREWLSNGGRAVVRINPIGSSAYSDDLRCLTGIAGLEAVMVAKSESATELEDVATQLGREVIALVESATGIMHAAAIAAAAGVIRLALGHLDLAADLAAAPTRMAMLPARSTIVIASRAAGLAGPIDGVTTALDDTETLHDDIAHARELGMTGKLLIHPRQVAPTHAAFDPTPAEIDWARRVLAVAESATGGAAALDGQMIDAPVVARARQLVNRKDR